ncbi:MAG: type VI secretion system baseplate subunit TssF [Polyangiaceae bacterium]
MSSFNRYFQDELVYLRELGREFAEAYPALAPMLADRGADPDVERLLEGVAFLTGRVRQKLDDELPEVIASVASLLFPHLLRPLPSATIGELAPATGALRENVTVPAGAEFGSVEAEGVQCRFRSATACQIVPWTIENVRRDSLPAGREQLRIELAVSPGASASGSAPDVLPLHFAGDVADSLRLLAWLHEECDDVALIATSSSGRQEAEVPLGRGAIVALGFAEDEALLPTERVTFPGFRLIQEYFALPQKFCFLGVRGLSALRALGDPARFAIAIRTRRRLPDAAPVHRDSVKLHCVPVVNVFRTTTEPLRLSRTRERYPLRPAGLPAKFGQIYSVLNVQAVPRGTTRVVDVPSFFDFRHVRASGGSDMYYALHYTPAVVGDGVDVSVSFTTPEDGDAVVDAETVSLEILATNGPVAGLLRSGDIRVPVPTSPMVATFRNIYTTTQFVPPPVGRELHWRVVAHMAMGIRGITELEVLKSALDVYNLPAIVNRQAARASELRADAMKALRVAPSERLYRGSIVRGIDLDLEVEESGFAGEGDLWLFGAILDRFFAHYVSLNAFTRLTVHGLSSKVKLIWPARSGNLTMT